MPYNHYFALYFSVNGSEEAEPDECLFNERGKVTSALLDRINEVLRSDWNDDCPFEATESNEE